MGFFFITKTHKAIAGRCLLLIISITGRPHCCEMFLVSPDEERAQLEKAAHLRAKRRANFKKLKAKMKAKKIAKKMASGGDPDSQTKDIGLSRKSGTDYSNASPDLPPAENRSRLLRTDNRLE